MKKQMLLILSVLLSIIALSAGGEALTKDDFTYTVLEDGTAEITGCMNPKGHVVIPDELEGHPVSRIGKAAFRDCWSLTGITIPDSVTFIGDSAFYDSGLTSVAIPDNVTTVRDGAFWNCMSLKNATLGSGIREIGKDVFTGCSQLTAIVIPDGVTSIPESAFSLCTRLAAVTLPPNLISIGKSAFYRCEQLTDITIPDGVLAIEDGAFYRCQSIRRISIPDSVTRIGDDGTFSGCSLLTEIVVSPGNTTFEIVDGALCHKSEHHLLFYPQARDAEAFTVPQEIRHIGIGAFYQNSYLTAIYIPDSVTDIGAYAFAGCDHLTSISIPDSVVSLGEGAFEDCTALSDVRLPADLKKLDYYTFHNCTSLTGINIPESVKEIKIRAFQGCTGLTEIVIPDGVTELSTNAFLDCTALTAVAFGKNVIEYDRDAFSGCSALSAFSVSPEQKHFAAIDGVLYSTDRDGSLILSLYPPARECETYEIPQGVTRIETNAFAGCTRLTAIAIPDSVTLISYSLFGYDADPDSVPVLVVIPDSYAESWALEKGYRYRYPDSNE